MLEIGIIDLGFREDSNAVTSVEDIIEYAIEAEKKGFNKFWLAEHHYTHVKNHPYTNTDLLLTIIAGMTEHIKLGSAGTSINLYSPYNVASNFKFLNNLFYDRISLGLSKGLPDSKEIISLANSELNEKTNFQLFNQNLETIHDLLNNEEKNLQEKGILIPPFGGLKPDMWYLSTSFRNFSDAIKYDLNYCVSAFHNFGQDVDNLNFKKEEIQKLKEEFFAVNTRYPKIAISLAIVLKDTLEEAKFELEKLYAFSEDNTIQPFIIIPTTIDLLEKRLLGWQEQFGIDEYVIYDLASTNEQKLKNLIS